MAKIVAMDIGGTFVKHALIEDGMLRSESVGQFPINEKGTIQDILGPILAYLKETYAQNVAVSIPGPMEYQSGTSRMLHKFVSLYGLSLKTLIEKSIPSIHTVFVHDGVAYLAGVMSLGETNGAKRPSCVMLGTGLGFAMAEEKKILINDMDTASFPLWNVPFREGIAEDYVSRRAIRSAYEKATGMTADVKEIAEFARNGNKSAQRVFQDTGKALGELMELKRKEQGIDLVILGGQISKASELLLPSIREETDLVIRPTAYPDSAALYGAASFYELGETIVKKNTRD